MWLVVGADSEIGAEALRIANAEFQPTLGTSRRQPLPLGRVHLDLGLPDLKDWAPPAGIESAGMCAAVARLAACATDPAGSSFVNVTQTLTVIERLIDRGIYVVFLSSNQVFDGRVPNVAADEPKRPASEYGKQKLRAELALEELIRSNAPVSILRLSKVVAPRTGIFSNWAEKLRRGEPVTAFDDMSLAPVPLQSAVAAMLTLMRKRISGVFQLSGPEDVTYSAMAKRLCSYLDRPEALVHTASASSSGLPTGATPTYTTMDAEPLLRHAHIARPDPWTLLQRCVDPDT
jgi:dTDP-4-dehydrorhamnose reductase